MLRLMHAYNGRHPGSGQVFRELYDIMIIILRLTSHELQPNQSI